MPNFCYFELRARGTREATDELFKDMYIPDDEPDRRRMARIFEAKVKSTTEHSDGTVTVHIAGECAWSALVCMTRTSDLCYGYGHEKDWFIGIEDEVAERNLSIEVHGFEPGMSFMERIICTPEHKLTNECFDAFELSYSPAYGETPDDLRRLDVEQLPQLCDELRQFIVEELSVNPGHLASSLGVVELTVALHYVFDTPEDRIVWDVGHQAYGHKILTGRRDSFCTNRKLGGLRPFPTPQESEYDAFICGHASNSISAALGMAVANAHHSALNSHLDRHVVAVIGDGAMSGGLAFEGLNNVSSSPNDMLIILNDNNMSIDRSVGGMKQYLLGMSTNETYNKVRFKTARWMQRHGMLKDDRRNGLIRLSNALKSAISHQQNIFEGMNIRYFGPFDGHNVKELVRILRQLKQMKGPKLLHLHTKKGHGYAPAENYKPVWHAPGKFDPETGKLLEGDSENLPPKYQDVFGETLVELARQNDRIVGVTPAMPTGCSMNLMMDQMPDRTFDVGIAEGHAVTFSAGMAKDGLQPFCNIYSAFAQRAYDNVIHDVAILKLPVVLCLDRAGLVGEDGPTHHGAFDLAYLRPIPNLTICSPMDEHELRRMMFTAQLPHQGPFVIRYPRRLALSAGSHRGGHRSQVARRQRRGCTQHRPHRKRGGESH